MVDATGIEPALVHEPCRCPGKIGQKVPISLIGRDGIPEPAIATLPENANFPGGGGQPSGAVYGFDVLRHIRAQALTPVQIPSTRNDISGNVRALEPDSQYPHLPATEQGAGYRLYVEPDNPLQASSSRFTLDIR